LGGGGGKRGPKRILFCILPLHLIAGTGFAAGRPVVPDAPKHRGAIITTIKRSKKGRQNILLTVTITWVPVTEHDFKRLAQTDVTNSSYRWTFLANGRAHFFSSLTAKKKVLRPFETSLFTHWQMVTFPSTWIFVYDLRFLKVPAPSFPAPNTILYFTVSYFFQIYVSTFRLLWCHSKQRICLYVFLSSSLMCEVEDAPLYVLLWFFIRDEVLYTNCRSACYTLGQQKKTRKREHKHKIEWEGFLLLTKT